MDTTGATDIGNKIPKWAMCMVCGDVIYAGPGFHPLPRECECGATVVLPREDRGYVKWDPVRYAANDATEPEIEYAKEGEVLSPVVPVAPPTTLSDVYRSHMNRIERGQEP